MGFRTVEISGPAEVHVKHRQLGHAQQKAAPNARDGAPQRMHDRREPDVCFGRDRHDGAKLQDSAD